jgi:hypothetical protein
MFSKSFYRAPLRSIRRYAFSKPLELSNGQFNAVKQKQRAKCLNLA